MQYRIALTAFVHFLASIAEKIIIYVGRVWQFGHYLEFMILWTTLAKFLLYVVLHYIEFQQCFIKFLNVQADYLKLYFLVGHDDTMWHFCDLVLLAELDVVNEVYVHECDVFLVVADLLYSFESQPRRHRPFRDEKYASVPRCFFQEIVQALCAEYFCELVVVDMLDNIIHFIIIYVIYKQSIN